MLKKQPNKKSEQICTEPVANICENVYNEAVGDKNAQSSPVRTHTALDVICGLSHEDKVAIFEKLFDEFMDTDYPLLLDIRSHIIRRRYISNPNGKRIARSRRKGLK